MLEFDTKSLVGVMEITVHVFMRVLLSCRWSKVISVSLVHVQLTNRYSLTRLGVCHIDSLCLLVSFCFSACYDVLFNLHRLLSW